MLTKHYSGLDQGPNLFFYVVLFLCLFQAKTGFILNFVGVITINIAINTWGVAMFQLNTFPSWANVTRAPWIWTQRNGDGGETGADEQCLFIRISPLEDEAGRRPDCSSRYCLMCTKASPWALTQPLPCSSQSYFLPHIVMFFRNQLDMLTGNTGEPFLVLSELSSFRSTTSWTGR